MLLSAQQLDCVLFTRCAEAHCVRLQAIGALSLEGLVAGDAGLRAECQAAVAQDLSGYDFLNCCQFQLFADVLYASKEIPAGHDCRASARSLAHVQAHDLQFS